jgi:hypothetical protein
MRALAVVLVVGCGRAHFDDRGDALTSNDALHFGDASDAFFPCTSLGPWMPPVVIPNVTPPINTDNQGPAISPDELRLYFESNRAGTYDLWVSQRASKADDFGAPVALSALNDPAHEDRGPALAAGGTRLYYSSDHITGGGADQIFVSSFDGTTYAPAVSFPELGMGSYGPWVSDDELEIFFSLAPGSLMRATRLQVSDTWGTPTAVSELPNASYPGLTNDRLTIFFEDAMKIYTATRTAVGASFSAPSLVDVLNAPFVGDGDPYISADGLTMYFAGDTGTGHSDLYTSTRTCL